MSPTKIAVVGCGIVGCLVAREIIERLPGSSVVILDRDAVGCGASRRSAGLHLPRGITGRVRAMSAYSQDFYDKLHTEVPSLPFYPLGMVLVSEASTRQLKRVYTDQAHLTMAAQASLDAIRVPPQASVWHAEGCHYADVPHLAQALVKQLRPLVSVREGVGVTAIEVRRHHVVLHLSAGDVLIVDKVVLAPGPWLAAPAWRHLVRPLGARVKKVVALHIEQDPGKGDKAIVFHDEDAFLLPCTHRGYWLFSYTCQEWDADADAVSSGVSLRNVEDAQTCLRRYSPSLAARCLSGRVFCDAYSGTGEPLVQPLDIDGHVVFAGAANGAGYRLAPAMAAEAVDVLTNLRRPRSFL